MSTKLWWRPKSSKRHGGYGPTVKKLISKLGDEIGEDDIDFLRGALELADGDARRELTELIEAIDKYGVLQVWEE